MRMKPNEIAFISLSVSILLSVLGQLSIKFGLNHVDRLGVTGTTVAYLAIFVNSYVVMGLSLYVLGSFLWVLSLSKIDLSFAYPMTSVQYVLGFLGAWYFLGENINLTRICGLTVICLGVGIMALDRVGYGWPDQCSN